MTRNSAWTGCLMRCLPRTVERRPGGADPCLGRGGNRLLSRIPRNLFGTSASARTRRGRALRWGPKVPSSWGGLSPHPRPRPPTGVSATLRGRPRFSAGAPGGVRRSGYVSSLLFHKPLPGTRTYTMNHQSRRPPHPERRGARARTFCGLRPRPVRQWPLAVHADGKRTPAFPAFRRRPPRHSTGAEPDGRARGGATAAYQED